MSLVINAYSTLTQPPQLNFPHKFYGSRNRSDPEMVRQLEGFIGYLFKCAGEDVTKPIYYSYRHIQRSQHQISCEIEENQLPAFSTWAWDANAIVFLPNGCVCDPDGNILVSPAGAQGSDAEAQLPFTESAYARKEKSEKLLASLNLHTPKDLPPVVCETEVVFRALDEVVGRLFSLALVAIRAESLHENNPISLEHFREMMPRAFESLTLAENGFIQSEAPEQQDIINFVWRYEALWTLAWSLNLVEQLPLATQICDVTGIAKVMLDLATGKTPFPKQLRNSEEILDALDLHYRLNWICIQANADDISVPGSLEQGVITERCHTLNWLTNFEYADWDDVTTPA